jgi:hypothetical protein
MDATLYVRIQLINIGEGLQSPYIDSRTRTGFGCTDDSDNVDSIFASPAWCEEDETATEGLLPINQPTNQPTNGTST